MTGNQYEQFVRAVLVRESNFSLDKLKSTKSPGVQFSGNKSPMHQIDLLYVEETEIAEYTTIIECKYHESRKSDQEEVQNLAYVRSDMRASKAILVTNNGFTDGAERIADAQKIALLVITPRIEVGNIEGQPNADVLFQIIDTKLRENPQGYDFDVKRKFVNEPNDRSIDLVSSLLSNSVIRNQTAVFAGNQRVQAFTKQVTSNSPNVVHKTMDFKRK